MSTLNKLISSFIGRLKPSRVKARSLAVLELPAVEALTPISLAEALRCRQSNREFSSRPLPLKVLSELLWSAYGVNRPDSGGRTAPSALNAQEIDVYAAMAGGVYLYEPRAHVLHRVAEVDARRVTGYQDFVDEAPLDLIYVADHEHMSAIPKDQRAVFSGAAAGAIAQNVYLYCAAAGLSTVVRGWLDHAALAQVLQLTEHEHVLLSQTVGYPA